LRSASTDFLSPGAILGLPDGRRALAIVCALAVVAGALGAAFSEVLVSALLALVILGIIVVPLARAHARASGYVVASMVIFGLLIGTSASHVNADLTNRLRLAELAILVVAALVAASMRRRPLPLVLLVTPLLLAMVDVAAFVNIDFSRVVLTSGLNIYLHYFLLAVFVYYSSFDEREMGGILVMMGSVILVITVLAVIQFVTGALLAPFIGEGYFAVSRAGFSRAIGPFTWPNELANFAGAWFFLFYCRAGRSGRGFFYSIVCAALVVIVLVTATRTVLVCIVVLIFFIEIRKLSSRRRLTVFAVLVAIVAILAVTSLSGTVHGASSTLSKSTRGYYLLHGATVFEHNPIVGVGFGRYYTDWAVTNDPGRPSVLDQYGIPKIDSRVATTDSFLASLMPEFGLVGAGVLLIFFGLLAWGGGRWRQADRPTHGYLWCLLFVALNTAGSSSVVYAPHTLALWIAVGMLARRLNRDRSANSSDAVRMALP
jgi:hypothetical protein